MSTVFPVQSCVVVCRPSCQRPASVPAWCFSIVFSFSEKEICLVGLDVTAGFCLIFRVSEKQG